MPISMLLCFLPIYVAYVPRYTTIFFKNWIKSRLSRVLVTLFSCLLTQNARALYHITYVLWRCPQEVSFVAEIKTFNPPLLFIFLKSFTAPAKQTSQSHCSDKKRPFLSTVWCVAVVIGTVRMWWMVVKIPYPEFTSQKYPTPSL